MCDQCTRENTEEDCYTCKPNFVSGENDACVCRPGFDVKTDCTTCLPGYLAPDCNVTKSYTLKPARNDNVTRLNNVVLAYSKTNMLYDGLYAAGDGRVPHSMHNSFVHYNGRLFWMHYAARTEIVGYDMCSLYNNAKTHGCAKGFRLDADGIYHCPTGVLTVRIPTVCPYYKLIQKQKLHQLKVRSGPSAKLQQVLQVCE